jgi:DNA-binding NarL/FixJ family response regulator
MMGANVDRAEHGAPSRVLRRVVIVADNSLLVEAIRIGFSKSGEFNLVGRADGRRTSPATILGAKPDVILLDDMDRSERGIELLRALRAENATVAIIVLSLHVDAEWLERLFAAGVTGVISKATHPVALATLVRETLDGHIFHRQPAVSKVNDVTPGDLAAEGLRLTGREREILHLVASGATNGDVARRLWVTEQTVKFHLRNIYRKLGVANRTQASHFAYARGLVDVQVGLPPAAELALKVAS